MKLPSNDTVGKIGVIYIRDVECKKLEQVLASVAESYPFELRTVSIEDALSRTAEATFMELVATRRIVWNIDSEKFDRLLYLSALWGSGCAPLIAFPEGSSRTLIWTPWTIEWRKRDQDWDQDVVEKALYRWLEESAAEASWDILPDEQKIILLELVLRHNKLSEVKSFDIHGEPCIVGLTRNQLFDGSFTTTLWVFVPVRKGKQRLPREIVGNAERFAKGLSNSLSGYLGDLSSPPLNTQCVLVFMTSDIAISPDSISNKSIRLAPPSLGHFVVRAWPVSTFDSLVKSTPGLPHWLTDRERLAWNRASKERDQLSLQLESYKSTLLKTKSQFQYQARLRERSERDEHWREASRVAAHKLHAEMAHVQILLAGLKSEDQVKADAQSALERGKCILKEFRDYTEATRVEFTPINLSIHLRNVLSVYSDGRFEVELVDKWPHVHLLGDEKKLTQVWEEIALNAKRAVSKPGTGGKLVVTYSHLGRNSDDEIPSNRGYIKLSFADNGPGVEEDLKTDIFKPNFTGRADGTGLGLYFVKQIITSHGGLIREVGLPGKGADFEILLPTGERQESLRHRSLSVLLADDDEEAARAYSNYLMKSFGGILEIDITFSEADARAKLRRNRYDAVITDMSMDRDISGVKLCIIAKTINPDTSTAIISGTLRKEEVQTLMTTSGENRSLSDICDKFLSKSEPDFPRLLNQIVDSFLRSKGVEPPREKMLPPLEKRANNDA